MTDIKQGGSESLRKDEPGTEDWVFVNHEVMRDVNEGVAELRLEGVNGQERDAEGRETASDEEDSILDEFSEANPSAVIERNEKASSFKVGSLREDGYSQG